MRLVANLRSALWAVRAGQTARRQLRRGGLEDLRLPPSPRVAPEAERGMLAALRLQRATCLVQAAVRQHWHAAHGSRREIVLGVTSPSDFAAHAWLDGDPPSQERDYHELLRQPPP